MQCPRCNSDLKLTERQEIQITYCPSCRGIWLNQEGINRVLQLYTSERLRVMRRFEEHFSAGDPQVDIPTEFKSKEERRQYEMRRLEEIQFESDFEEKPRRGGGFLNDIFDIFD